MKTAILTLAMTMAMPALAFAQDKCYDEAKDQPALNACADAAFKKSDKKLNELYQQIETRLNDDADTKKLLVQAQRDWVKFRDAECNFQTAEAAGGSMMAMLAAQCTDGLTQSRIKNFEAYLKCEEGDMSCPVPAAAVSAPASSTSAPAATPAAA
ncbi:MAG: lysozyme inhibitor LprI family protein, partial [Alphaproteobacteria bacterium]